MPTDASPARPARRRLLKGAAAAALLAPGAALAAGPRTRFDHTVDAVVIGSGTGLCGAITAAAGGAKVLVLEKHAMVGGTTVVSGGVAWVPNNNVLRREGLQDDRESALRYLRKLSQGQADEELMEAFVDNGGAMLDFLEANSPLRFRVSLIMGKVADYHPDWADARLRGRSVEPVQETMGLAGGRLVGGLLEGCRDKGVEILAGTPARRLIVEERDGRRHVVGVEALREGKPWRVRARRGVLMASGGFERNPEMMKHFLRGPVSYVWGAESNEGDGIRMGMDVGADLRNMNECWGQAVYTVDGDRNGHVRGAISLYAQIERRYPASICVNRYGKRFANESAAYDVTWPSFLTWENWLDLGYSNIPAFHICDQTVREKLTVAGAAPGQALPDYVASADTLEELAGKLGMDAEGLRTTVERFNANARAGRDPDFHRGESPYDRGGEAEVTATLAPIEKAPFYGISVSPGALGTCGGLRVNRNAQVLSVWGEPIPGLYASGNTSGVGSPGALYGGGGGTIGPALTFAYIAGKQLAG